MLDKYIYGLGLIYTLLVGLLAAIAIIYFICNYIFQLMKANEAFFAFIRHRKEFEEWNKNRSKLDLKKLEENLDKVLSKETKESLEAWIEAMGLDIHIKTKQLINKHKK